MRVLGINLSHNGSVCLVDNGKILFYLEEERITRKKRDGGAINVVKLLLESIDVEINKIAISATISYDKSNVKGELFEYLKSNKNTKEAEIVHVPHHIAHALSAVYTSTFDDCLVFVVDGAGEQFADGNYETESVFHFKENKLELLWKRLGNTQNSPEFVAEQYAQLNAIFGKDKVVITPFSHITKCYEAVCTYLGYEDHEAGKVMGLSSYGEPKYKLMNDKMYGDPTIFASKYPGYARIAYNAFIDDRRLSDGKTQLTKECDKRYFDLAASVQHDTQDAVIKLIKRWVDRTGVKNVCTAGGYFLNSICNQAILTEIPDINLWSMPVAHDGGTAIGSAYFNMPAERNQLKTLSLGGEYQLQSKEGFIKYSAVEGVRLAASLLSENKTIIWYSGRSEAGPRALGNRSFLSDPRDPNGRDKINMMKGREWYRPLAGSCLSEHIESWFDVKGDYRHMMYVTECKIPEKVPAMLHVDGTCRVQSIIREEIPVFHALIHTFYRMTGVPMVLNTSLNLAGEPLVETPEQAEEVFNSTSCSAIFVQEGDDFWVKVKDE